MSIDLSNIKERKKLLELFPKNTKFRFRLKRFDDLGYSECYAISIYLNDEKVNLGIINIAELEANKKVALIRKTIREVISSNKYNYKKLKIIVS